MAAPPFSLPRPAPHSPHVSNTVFPAIYAIAIAAIGKVISITTIRPRHPYIAVEFTHHTPNLVRRETYARSRSRSYILVRDYLSNLWQEVSSP